MLAASAAPTRATPWLASTSARNMPADHRHNVGWQGFIKPAWRPGNRARGMLGWWGQPSILRSMHPDTPRVQKNARSFRRPYKGNALAGIHVRQPHARRPPPDRRLGWLHQPSLRAGQSDTKLAGLMKPTQPTAMPWTPALPEEGLAADRKSTRLNSSH